MINEEYLLKIVCSPHVSEKTSNSIEKTNTIVFKVTKNSTKEEIKNAIQKIFKVRVKDVNTLIIKGKVKRFRNHFGRHKDWKKAYVILEKGQNLNFLRKTE